MRGVGITDNTLHVIDRVCVQSVGKAEAAITMPDLPTKVCVACGRQIRWRKKWERDWENVRYCSDACRRRKPSDLDGLLEAELLHMLQARPASATICPSEVARAIASRQLGKYEPGDWPLLMEPVRTAARRLVAAGRVLITQRGRVVDPSTARGAIRIRRAK